MKDETQQPALGDPVGSSSTSPPPVEWYPAPAPLRLEPEAPATSTVRRSGLRKELFIGVAAVVVLVIGLVSAQGRLAEADPEEVLEDAQAAMADAESFGFDLLIRAHVATGDPDGPGMDTTVRSVMHGEVDGEDWHFVEERADEEDELGGFEALQVGDEVFSAFGEEGPGQRWTVMPVPTEEQQAENLEMLAELVTEMDGEDDDAAAPGLALLSILAYTGDLTMGPRGITRTIADLQDPETAEARGDGGTLVRASLPPAADFADLIDDLPSVDAVLVTDAEGRPSTVSFRAGADDASAEVEVTLDWSPVSVEAPEEREVDRTPWIDERGIAGLSRPVLLVPEVDAPLELVSAGAYEDELGASGCSTLTLSYATQELAEAYASLDFDDEDAWAELDELPQLDVEVTRADCVFDEEELGEGGYFDTTLGGLPAAGEEGYWEVLRGDVVVVLMGTFDDEQAARWVASLRPTTAVELRGTIAAWVAGIDAFGTGYGTGMFAF